MPWCESCLKYLAPTALRADGACPSCGAPVAPTNDEANAKVTDERTPWHFKLLVGAVAFYLGWRLVQLIGGLL